MTKNIEKLNISFKIVKIKTIKFSCEEIDENLTKDGLKELGNINFDIGINLNINNEKSAISVDIISKLIDVVNKKTIIEHIGRTEFLLKGLEQTFDPESNQFNLPNELLINLYSLAYSHSRVLLLIGLTGTSYQDKLFLPIIDPRKFLKVTNQKK